jgi:hypothetical protein
MKSFIDEGCKALSIMKQKLFFLGKKGFWIQVRLGVKWYGVNRTVTSFSNRDGGILVVHVNTIEGGGILFIVIKKGELGEFS